ncbi:phenol 2-monooxygenase [Propioniferax innocua]|uniref:propane 2-monooxygenase n=1 Tax=Propioniferax innocua TaxID=1753 RepID=A0A542ZDU1_9ACTN|nr:phenol 2-monooxygenase [Propioniferax innocua]TQL58449.1 phenol 2-monooxygenase P1 subunit [Propioniferax innocua]
MQYELKTQVIEPTRHTFDHIAARYGDRPATRYQEGTIGLQPKENFHYRPSYAPEREMYDVNYSAYKLADPEGFVDPRGYYYTPYVTNRSEMHEGFGASLEYVTKRELFGRTPDAWKTVMTEVLIPTRHYESGAQMLFSGACRFCYGSALAQCCAYESFDRVGNAQLISRIGIALGDQTATVLREGKRAWMEAEHMQPLRKLIEELLIEEDWADSVTGIDYADRLLSALLHKHLEEVAINNGAGAYSLLIQHLDGWYAEHRKWLDALYKAWTSDETHGASNIELFSASANKWLPQAEAAVRDIAARADELLGADAGCVAAVEAAALETREALSKLGLTVEEAR